MILNRTTISLKNIAKWSASVAIVSQIYNFVHKALFFAVLIFMLKILVFLITNSHPKL